MIRIILIALAGLLLCSYNYSQTENFGYRNASGNVSSVFLVQDGFILDSANSNGHIFRFEYNQQGKLSRDINIITFPHMVTVDGRQKFIFIPGCRDFYYNKMGDIDSLVATGWDDSLSVYLDNPYGYTIRYSYDNNGVLLSKTTLKGGIVSGIEKYCYDSKGNITSIQMTSNGPDTASVIREYDLLNRLTSVKNIINNIPNGDQYIYQYDSSGNINCLFQSAFSGMISNKYNYLLKFDESDKVIDEISLSMFLSDSTWGDTSEISFDYDEYGRIIQMGQYTWFHYDPDGNLDSMVNTHTNRSGYLANKGTFTDTYGNSITLPYYDGINHFYYSRFITGIKKNKSNIKTFSLSQNYPNPFNPVTTINYSIPKAGFVTLKVYDILGREIASLVNDVKQPGEYSAKLYGTGLSSGVHFYQLKSGEFISTKKFILMK